MDEAAFIAALRALAPDPAARGLDDDVAVIALGGEHLILTHDMMVEGVHWLPGQDPADVAWKLVATNLSDLAAKGAQPLGVLLGYGLGGGEERFLVGLGEALQAFAVPLLGGDTVRRAGAAAHGLTALGRATCLPVPTRGGARPGDALWVTGMLGDAMLGFEALRDARSDRDTTRFARPVPRLAEGQALAPLVGAMMDVSDGLLLDATRMALASGVTLAIDSTACPVPEDLPATRRRDALAWGDDYELLFTLPAGQAPPCPATCIGHAQPAGAAPLLLDSTGPQGRLGYQHQQ
ncbi:MULTISPECIES: thiamine-phosphate kinase [unclassified Sphingomonas]|uniref:thiamine-phosphate kinase n=1 Tax=Novosphingobium rhizosphaerae TaxID=1551649 RepID=UPI0015CA0EF8